MKTDFTEKQQYIVARKKVEKIRKFYQHLSTYLLINIFLSVIFIVGDVNDGDTFREAFLNYKNYKIWFFWGIAIVLQAFLTFGIQFLLGSNWEQNKIKEYMNNQNN